MKISILATASFLALATVTALPAVAHADGASTVKSVDKDGDGTISLDEAKSAAMDKFAMLDKDKDGTLDSKEAGMDVSKVDPDKDGTVDKTEFESALTKSFAAADTDNDGTVDAKELSTSDGKKLAKMIK